MMMTKFLVPIMQRAWQAPPSWESTVADQILIGVPVAIDAGYR